MLGSQQRGGTPLPEVFLRWRCGAEAGEAGPFALEEGVRDLPPATFAAPALDNAAVQRLELALVADRRAIATNHLELTILPQRGRPPRELQIWAADELADRIQSLGYRPALSLLEAGSAPSAPRFWLQLEAAGRMLS